MVGSSQEDHSKCRINHGLVIEVLDAVDACLCGGYYGSLLSEIYRRRSYLLSNKASQGMGNHDHRDLWEQILAQPSRAEWNNEDTNITKRSFPSEFICGNLHPSKEFQ